LVSIFPTSSPFSPLVPPPLLSSIFSTPSLPFLNLKLCYCIRSGFL
jgi:hypothetical protein